MTKPEASATYTGTTPGYIKTTYTDRRGSAWYYHFNRPWQNLYPDGNLNWIQDPLYVGYLFYYDANRNLTDIIDGDYSYWTRQFDSQGNMTHAVDPLEHGQSWTYDAYNNVTSYTDAAGNVTRVCYENTTYPTLLTKILEPDDAMNPSSPPDCAATGYATTTLNYYTGPSENKQLKEIIDPNGVRTGFDYDQWGQSSVYAEGFVASQTASGVFDPANYVYVSVAENDSAGNTTSSESSGDEGGGSSGHDNHGNKTSSKCRAAITQQSVASTPSGFPAVTCTRPVSGGFYTEFSSATYSARDELLNLPLEVHDNGSVTRTRTHSAQYDALGRPIETAITSNESGYSATRTFGFDYDPQLGQYTRHGPDEMDTFVQMNTASRIEFMQRGFPAESPVLAAFYDYNNLGLLTSIVYGNEASTTYQYDVTHRLTQISHRDASSPTPQTIVQLDYTYTADNLPKTITESVTVGALLTMTTHVEFSYDTRRRLVHEVRETYDSSPEYDLTYVYDAGGNRTGKIDELADIETRYHYDLEDPVLYGSNNNRLMFYKEFDTTQTGDPGDPGALLSTTWYYYHYGTDGKSTGNVERVVTKAVASATYESTFFAYAKNGRTVTHVVGEQWNDDGLTDCFPLGTHGYVNTFGWEFRYDGARARYAARGLQLDNLNDYVSPRHGWSDYDRDEIYDDFTVETFGPPTTTRRFEPGIGRTDYTGSAYYHADHLGTIRGLTNSSATWTEPMAFTAFGERIVGTQNSTSTRFGYVGSYGYESTPNFGTVPNTDIGFLHVGARYYDPATGRFLQRDPIGIVGGINVYEYVGNTPTAAIDPLGLQFIPGPPKKPWDPMDPQRRPRPVPQPSPPQRPRPRPPTPETPAEEIARINRRLNNTAAGFAGAAALTWWFPPAAITFGACSAAAWAAANSVY